MPDGSIIFSTKLDNAKLEKDLGKLRNQIEKLEKELSDKESEKSVISQQLDAVTQKAQETEANIKRLKAEFSSIQDMKDPDKGSFGDIDPDAFIEALEREKQITRELEEQEKLLEAQIKESDSLFAKYSAKEENVAKLTGDIEHLKEEAGGVQKRIDDNNAKLRELSDSAKKSNAHIASLSGELARLKDAQKALEEAGMGYGYEEYDQNAARIAEINRELKEYQKNLTAAAAAEKQTKLSMGDDTSGHPSTAPSRLNAYLEKTSGLYQKLTGMSGKMKEVSSVLQEMAGTTTGKLSGAFQTAGTAIGGFSAELSGAVVAAGPYIAIALAVVSVLKKVASAMWEFGKEATQSLISGTKAVASFAASGAKAFVSMLKSIGKFGKTAIKTISGLTKKVLDFGKRINVFSKIADTLSGKFKRLGSTIKSALVFSVIYKGLSLLREQMGAYLNVNTQFMTALRRLQGVLLTAFQPIYEVVVPALTTLINVLARAAATVTQFFASLFGTTAKQAQANAKDLYDQASATTAAGDAAEEASKQLAGFDEINKLEGNKKTGAGGSTSVDTGPLFDYEYDETPFDSWGEAFSGFLDKLLGGIPKLRDAFKDFADWLNGLTKKLYDMFTFPGVLDKVKRLGRELAEALNDLVNWIDWYQLGQALGAGLNLALNFLTSFLYAFDWMNLGRKLAEFVNGLVSEIDWYEFGRLLWAGFKIGLETFAGFLDNLDMPQLAQAASNIILGFFTEMENTIRRIPWFNLGRQIALFLNEIQWYDIITSIADAIHAGIIALYKLVRGFIGRLDWDGIAEQIYTAINASLGNKALFYRLGEVFSSLFIHIFDFCRKVIAGIDWEQLGRDIAALILDFDWVGALGSLADLIAEGINAAIRLVRGFLDKIMPEIKGIAEGIAERLKNAVASVHWDELGRAIGDAIKTALSLVAGLLDPQLFYEIGKAIGEFLISLDWPGVFAGLSEVLANAINSAVALVKGFLDVIEPNIREIAEGIADSINEFVEKVDWEDLGETLNRGIQAALDFLVTLMDKIDWNAIKDAVQSALSKIDWADVAAKVAKLLVDWFGIKAKLEFLKLETLIDIGISIIDGIKKGILKAILSIPIWLKEHLVDPIVNAVKDFLGIHSPSTVFAEIGENLIAGLLQGITETWHGIVDFFSEKLEALKQTLSDAWENIKKDASEKWENIKKMLGDKWEEVKKSAQEKFEETRKKVAEAWENVKKDVPEKWEAIKTALKTAWDGVRESAREKFEEVRQKVSEAWNNVKSDVPGKWEEIKTTLSTAWEGVKTAAQSKFGEIKDKIIEKMDEIKNKDWSATGKSVVDGIMSGLESIWNKLTGWAKSVKDTISDALSGASSARSGSFGSTGRSGSFGGSSRMSVRSMPDIGNFEIPALAKGAVIPPNREFLAVLGDQKHGNNLEMPESTLRRIMREESGRGSQKIEIQFTGSLSELARVLQPVIKAEERRRGVQLVEAHS